MVYAQVLDTAACFRQPVQRLTKLPTRVNTPPKPALMAEISLNVVGVLTLASGSREDREMPQREPAKVAPLNGPD